MRLKPSCSWCRDHELFVENKKLRVLIQCFKKMCDYISHSQLGIEIAKTQALNGCGAVNEELVKLLKDADQFQDDEFTLTPPPKEMDILSQKPMCGGIKSSFDVSKPPNGSVAMKKSHKSAQPSLRLKRGRGRPTNSEFPLKKSSSNSLQAHANKLRKKAINSKIKNNSESGLSRSKKNKKTFKKVFADEKRTAFAAQRPHRDKSGKFSVGQLWRETFLEEIPPQDAYPDSGIEVGNSSDQDQNNVVSSESAPSTSGSDTEIPRKETRQSKLLERELRSELSVRNISDSTREPGKPRLTLKISKRHLRKYNDLNMHIASGYNKEDLKMKEANNNDMKSRHKKTCRCARFKTPNQLTCFGQKCPCYSDKRGCINCLCHGCKNPLQANCNSAPSLTHVLRDSENLESSFDSRSMPRLSPII